MKLLNIKAKLAAILAELQKVSTDKGVLSSSDEEIVVGSSVAIVDEEGNESAAEDGEYTTAEGRVYVVADGKVTEIKEKETAEEEETTETASTETEVAASVEAPAKEKFNKVKAAFEASYEEKEIKISEAIRAKGLEAWIIEAGDDFAVAEVWSEEDGDWHYERFAISWDEEGNVIVGESEEVKSEFVPIDAKSPFEESAETEDVAASAVEPDEKDEKITNLEAENFSLKQRIVELENQPADVPATEKFEKVQSTGNVKLDRLNRILNA